MSKHSTHNSRHGNINETSGISLYPNTLFFTGNGSSNSPFESSSSQRLENCFSEAIKLAYERRKDIWFMFAGLVLHFKVRHNLVSLETPLHSRPTKPEVSNGILNALHVLLEEYR
jgi:hypothetical protein